MGKKNSFLIRAVSGVAFVIAVIGGSLNPYTFAAVILFCMIVMMNEYFKMTVGLGKFIPERILSICAASAFFVFAFCSLKFGLGSKYLLLTVIPVIASFITLLYSDDKNKLESGHLFAPLVYIAVPMTLTNLLVFGADGSFSPRLFLSVMILVWMNDVGAYLFGMSLGQRSSSKKLFPSISPKKSWAGVWGGALITAVSMVAIRYFGLIDYPVVHCVAMVVIAVVFGDFGDLYESLIKRCCGCKDAGKIMPGHGGFLDRFDAALFVIPMIVIYLKMFSII